MERIAVSIGNVSWPECFEALKCQENASLVDVRTKEEWDETGIADLSTLNKEAKLISWIHLHPEPQINSHFLSELIADISNKNAPLYFICKSGGRSGSAAIAANQAGFSHCFNVTDGFASVTQRRPI